VGIGYNQDTKLIIAKEGTTFYQLAVSSFPLSMTLSFTVPQAATQNYPVYFEFVNTTTTSYVYFCSYAWNKIYSWDFTAAAAVVVHDFGEPVSYICWHNGHMFALVGQKLWASDNSDPATWPTANFLALSTTMGTPKAIKSLQDRLLIFASNGIWYMVGDFNTNRYIGSQVSNMPFNEAESLVVDGGTAIFQSYENYVQLGANLNILTNTVMGLPLDFSGSLGHPRWLAASPEYIVARGAEAGGAALLFVYERIRTGAWWRFRYSTDSALGSVAPKQLIVFYAPLPGHLGFLIPSSNGNIYFQPVMYWTSLQANPMWSASNADEGTPQAPITNTITTRYTGIVEDRLCTKQIREIAFEGFGTLTGLTLKFIMPDGATVTKVISLVSTVLPVQQPIPMQVPWQECQIIITGVNLAIRDWMIVWRPVRYTMGIHHG
jgi:hypothetical protein